MATAGELQSLRSDDCSVEQLPQPKGTGPGLNRKSVLYVFLKLEKDKSKKRSTVLRNTDATGRQFCDSDSYARCHKPLKKSKESPDSELFLTQEQQQ